MKFFSFLGLLFVTLCFSSLEARDLTYRFGAGYQQIFTNGFVPDGGNSVGAPTQLNGISASYGIARDMHIEAFAGFQQTFDLFVLGPGFRYDFQRLIYRDLSVWRYLNMYVKAAFMLKGGDQVETGIVMHLPYVGFEVLPFDSNNFAIHTSAGVAIDLLEDSQVGFTDGMFGDVGVKMYF